MNPMDALLIVGATGVVGQQLTRLLRQRHPQLPLLIAGRDLAKAERLAAELGHAQAQVLDVRQPGPLRGLRPRAVLALVNDPQNFLLDDALRAGSAYLDITRWTERLKTALERVTAAAPSSPVLLASGWMAGLVSTLAGLASQELARVERIELNVFYALKDRSGPDSVEYMARLATPFEAFEQGRRISVKPYSDPRQVVFPSGRGARVYRFDTPDPFMLSATTGARSVSARIAFDDRLSMPLLIALRRSGLWRLIGSPRFKGLRQAILHNPGGGAPHELLIEVQGLDRQGQPQGQRIGLHAPLGQTHLTALGTLLQLERLLGLDGAAPPPAGLLYPSTALSLEAVLQGLATQGVTVSRS